MLNSLKGKTALISGASSGIGRATARRLAAEGVRVALVARSAEKLEGLAAELPAEALVLAADLTRAGEAEGTINRAIAHFGHLDILFANAGVYIPGVVAEGDPDAWEALFTLNVDAVFRAVRAVLPSMIARGSGDILVTSSISGHHAIAHEPVYSASKHAIQAFVHGLRRQVAPQGIRVGAIAPGTVLNELWGYTDPAKIAAKVEARAGLTSEDIAETAVFMLTRPPNVTIRDLVILPFDADI